MKVGDTVKFKKPTKDEELKKGDRVRFRRVVDPGDDKIVMELIEDPDGGRVLVQSLIWDELNPTRVLPTSELIKVSQTEDIIKIIISADGFLYNMVRIIVGTLIKVGTGKLKAEEIENIIIEGNRKKSGMCAPPNGLILEKVFY